MKDSEGDDLVVGDLYILVIDTPIDIPTQIVIFLSVEEYVYSVLEDGTEVSKTTHTVKYYPITEDALEVAKYDYGVEQLDFHREQKYTVDNAYPRNLIPFDKTLVGYQKTIYDAIIAAMATPQPDPVVAPVLTLAPVVVQTVIAKTNDEFTCTTGGWTSAETLSYTYKWFMDSVEISGQTTSTLVQTTTGRELVYCEVTATNSAGSLSANSNTVTGA